MHRVRCALVSAALAVASALAAGGPVQAAPANGQSSGQAMVAHLAGRFTPQTATIAGGTAAAAAPSLPFHAPDASALAAAKASPRSSAARVRSLTAAAAPKTLQAGPLTLLTHDTDVAVLGADIEPPDTQLAAGPTELFEQVNDVGLITNKSGAAVSGPFDMNQLFQINPATGFFFTDPRVVFDAESGRWFFTGLAVNPSTNASRVLLAVSGNSSAALGGVFYIIDDDPTRVCDQPKIGVNTDKVTVSCANFSTTAFLFQSTFVINKGDLLAAVSLRFMRFDDPKLFNPVPAVSLSPTSTAFMVENDSRRVTFCSAASVVLTAFSGVPGLTAVSRSDTCLPMTATAVPPNAVQPAGGVPAIATNDDRFLSATYQQGLIWTGGNDACTPPGDSTVRACMRFVSIGTSPQTTIASTDFGASGAYDYFPAVTMDQVGDLFASYTTSSSATFPSTAAFTMPVGASAPDNIGVLQSGNAAYQDTFNSTRWGDYSAAAPDPASPGSVWVTAEFSRISTLGIQTRSWGTSTAKVSAMRNEVGVEGAGDTALWHFQDTLPPTAFSSLGGGLGAAPAVVSLPDTAGGPATPIYIATGSDHGIWMRSQSQGWQPLTPPGICIDNPAAVVTQTKPAGGLLFTVACQGMDRALWFATAPITSGSLPIPSDLHFVYLGGVLQAGPSVAAIDPHGTATVADELTFFVDGSDGAVWSHTANTSSGWVRRGWQCLGHVGVSTAVTATTEASMLACHGSDGQLWIVFNFGGANSWGTPMAQGGSLLDGTAAAMDLASPVAYVEGGDGHLWRWEAGAFTFEGGNIVHGAGAAALLPLSQTP